MSNALAISAVTQTLLGLIDDGLRDRGVPGMPGIPCKFSTLAPDLTASKKDEPNLLGLFLYNVTPNPAWRNDPIAGRGKRGENVPPPLALNLHYLITVFAVSHPGVDDHQVLGRVMLALHDNALLSDDDFKEHLPKAFRDTRAIDQIERVKITPVTLSGEQMTRLWSSFQTGFRLSVAYEASVVLIDSTRLVKAALPVLSRGRGTGADGLEPGAGLTFPTLAAAHFPYPNPPREGQRVIRRLTAGRVRDALRVEGENLGGDGDDVILEFRHRRLRNPYFVEIPPGPDRTASRVLFRFPDPANRPAGSDYFWPAGHYTLSARVRSRATPAREATTNEVSFGLAPDIDVSIKENDGGRALVIDARPPVWPGQRVSLLLGDHEVPVAPTESQARQFWFPLRGSPAPPAGAVSIGYSGPRIEAGRYAVRLRVDGVDSLLFDPEKETLTIDDKYLQAIPQREPDL